MMALAAGQRPPGRSRIWFALASPGDVEDHYGLSTVVDQVRDKPGITKLDAAHVRIAGGKGPERVVRVVDDPSHDRYEAVEYWTGQTVELF
jgi:hypothetical protein